MDPVVVILSRGPQLYSTKRLVEEAEKLGWVVKVVDPLRISGAGSSEEGLLYRSWPLECDAVIPRIGYSITNKGCDKVLEFEKIGIIVMNSSEGIRSSRDKLNACQMMSSGNIPVPITVQVNSWEDTNRAITRVGGTPCVVKATEGTHGAGVFLAQTEQHAKQLVYQMLERDMGPLVQEYIEESHGKDIRALVVGGKVVACMRRKAHGNEFRSNFHLGGSVEKIEISDEFEKIAIKAAKILGLEVAGVDMLESKRGPLVLEVNSSPGLEGIEKASGINVAGAVTERMDYLLKELKQENIDSSIKEQGLNFDKTTGLSES